ncbi:MAG: flagellar biosynthetic protein FliO [Spirochaetaceae bacterium]|nr:flagellar biosynthetic protein FliO [Spirochaetaceae bacterium]
MLTLVFLVAGLMAWAQETDTVPVRPAETELLFEDTPVIDADVQAPDVNELPGVSFGDFLRVILVLGIIIALIYAFVWMLKKFTSVKAEGGDAIQLYSTRPLKGDAALHLVEAGNRVFLIGSNGNSVNLISEIDDKESIDEIRLNASAAPQSVSGGFARLFKDRFGSGPSTDASDKSADEDPASYIRKQRERLKDL